MTTTELHTLRSAQLKALCNLMKGLYSVGLRIYDLDSIQRYADLCGENYDTRNLSDKALEEIQTLASKYLEQVK